MPPTPTRTARHHRPPINRLGIAGVAPNVTLVNIRAGQDSGYFFLAPSLDALTYAADIGVDVVNMSFYIDPWLFNCTDNPADPPQAQIEQRTIIEATQRALNYAHRHRVTLVSAIGNGDDDLGRPETDTTSPDFPEGAAYPRPIDNDSCLSLPTEGNHVIAVTGVGPSTRKSYYSDYGVEQAEVAAPGGDRNDYPGTPQYRSYDNLILSAYPAALALERGEIDANGEPVVPYLVKNCANGTCGYYAYFQGTSMASPHAVGVAALIVSEYGRRDRNGGLTMNPNRVEQILERTATDTPCPEPRLQTYITGAAPAVNPQYTALCEGSAEFNGFYGEGIVDALAAVTSGRFPRD